MMFETLKMDTEEFWLRRKRLKNDSFDHLFSEEPIQLLGNHMVPYSDLILHQRPNRDHPMTLLQKQ